LKAIEIWKDIPGFPGYQASSFGRVQSSRKILKTAKRINNSGYQTVNLPHGIVKSVHWCVLMAFEPKFNFHVNHIDGNKLNNNIENLEWVSRSQNMKHAFKNGLAVAYNRMGERNPRAKLTNAQRVQIRDLYATGQFIQKQIAVLFNIKQPQISAILRGH
jgi:predicted XRE-type DNA-binding protein